MDLCLGVYKRICFCESVCLSSVLFCFSGSWRILVTRWTSEICSGSPLQQLASSSSSSRQKEYRLSRGLGRMIADPIGRGRDGTLLFQWVVEQRERSEERMGELNWGHDTHEREEWQWWWRMKAFGLVAVKPAFWHQQCFPSTPTYIPTSSPPQSPPPFFSKYILFLLTNKNK